MSLRTQIAVGSVLVALAAVLIVALTTLVAVSIAFRNYQRAQLAAEAQRTAATIGQGRYFADANGPSRLKTVARQRQTSTADVWILDAYGHMIVAPTTLEKQAGALTQDQQTVTDALLQGLQGHSSEGVLRDPYLSLLALRVYAVEPIYQTDASGSTVVGAVAFSTPPRAGTAAFAVFQTAVIRIVAFSGLAATLLAVIAAILYARHLSRPLGRLSVAAGRMAGGDYATRVAVRSPDEYRRLAENFNEMAGALEHDVNELQRQERLRRELVANVSHELATPLTAISGFTEALLDGVVHSPGEREETIRRIARESARLRRLVDQLRQVALYEAGAKALDRAPLQLAPLAEETLAVLAPEMARKAVQAVNRVSALLPLVYADGDRLTEILLNLMDNALRHVPAGGFLEVDGALEGTLVRVTIADSGPGIKPQDRQRIFDRFYRSDPSRTSATGGSGLGLAIVRALVEAHGGSIRADERPGGGARFSFTLPVYMLPVA